MCKRIHVTIRPLNREDSVLYFPPEAFGPFRVLHQIGAGTLGPVFRAYEHADDRRDRLVTVKVFRLDLTPEQAAALVGEFDAIVAADITHPNIASPIAAGLEHGALYLAQEYAVGESLDVVLRERGPMPLREVAALVDSLAAAIDHAAERGVHHGFLHPRDIVLSADGVRITGFGVAAALEKVGATLPGRNEYASAGVSSDVYALGAIAFEAATGKPASAINLQELEAQYGSELRLAFDAPLSANPEKRPRRAGDFAVALASAVGVTDATGANAAPVAPAPVAPIAPDSDFDFRVDQPLDLMALPDEPIDRFIESPSQTPVSSSWAAESPRAFAGDADVEPEPASRRWPIVAMFLVFAVAVASLVGWFLRSPRPTPVTGGQPGVDATVVDLPASAPAPPVAAAGKPARSTPVAPRVPSPSPSRPASGAVRGAQTGSVLIRSSPAEADVLVNGKPRGKTPLALRDLALGSYTIRVARDGYAIEERTVQLTARRPTTSTTFDLRSTAARGASASTTGASVDRAAQKTGPGGLNVQSRPAGARVFVNDRLAGSTPIAIPDLPAGPATVRIEMDGYQPWTTRVRVSAGEEVRVAASLERR